MLDRRILLGSAAVLMLAACSKKSEPATLVCDQPHLASALQQQLLQSVSHSARQFAQNDSRQFVDADKVIAAASQLTVVLTDAKAETANGKELCSATLSVTLAADTWKQAQENTPILYPQQLLPGLLQGQLVGSEIRMDGAVFSQPIRYVPSAATASAPGGLSIEAPGIAQFSHVLTNALLPYGVKDILVINGKPYSRAEAMTIIANGGVPAAASEPLPPQEASAPQTASAPSAAPPDPTAEEFQQAQRRNQSANSDINRLWNSLDDTVRTELQADQRQWVNSKTSRCAEAALQGGSSTRAEYLRLQCDTQMTQERLQYLRGFAAD
ncbi:uncharacterized protein YecT (DUF1311 family) [Neisseria sp. HSC-16F19]|nr:lysozyme inhibitor LprI family protein [Neisseria sp. HSC-16F19]MCP2041528.1 uncharacterized protein YecT (DUF1311 family) [Neisseria sp. HSC-16F19]